MEASRKFAKTQSKKKLAGQKRKHLLLKAAGVVLVLGTASSTAWGQVRSATVSGSVRDPAGRVLVGADVTVVETLTDQKYQVKSNSTGNFTVPYLPSGQYMVTVTDAGFETTSENNVKVGTGESINLNVTMKVGANNQTVDVTSESSGIQLDTPTVQSSISEEVIASIPNINHNALSYVQLEAGVNTRAAGASATNANSFGIGIQGRREISDFAINGGQAYENDIQLDGLSTQSPGFNEVTVIVNTDAIHEVRALVNDYGAQYGRAHGVIQEATKGGTNQLHGLAFMRNRSSVLAAGFYSNTALAQTKLPSEIWTYGGTIGGPIKKSKAFFFASFEGLYYDKAVTFLRSIPTAQQRIGDFSQTLVNVGGTPTALNLYDPFNVTPAGNNVYNRAQIAGANTNNSVLGTNKFALNVLSHYPCAPTTVINGATLPACTNRVATDVYGTNNFQSTVTQTYRKANINARVDYHLRSNDNLYITGGFTHGDIVTPLIWSADNLFNPVSTIGEERFDRDRDPYISIGNTLILSPTLVLDVRYGLSRVDTQDSSDIVPNNFDYSSLGISAIDQANNPVQVVPSFNVSGGGFSPVNNNQFFNKHEKQTDHVVAGSITKARGKWNYRVGGEYRVYLANYTDSQTSFVYNLSSSFTAAQVRNDGVVVNSPTAQNAGNAYASFLLGAGSVGIPAGQAVHPAFGYQYAGIYTQNDWKPTEKLTVNLGARWDWQPGISERYGRDSSIDLNATNPFGGAGGVYFPGAHGNSKRLWDTDWLNFQPRFGLAYRAQRDTVIRGGVGVTFLPSNSGFFDGPYLFGATSFDPYTNTQPYGLGVKTGVPVGTFDSAAVNNFVPATGADLTSPALYGGVGGPRFVTRGFKNSYVYQGNVHVQQDLHKGWTADFGYNVEVGKRLPLGTGFTFGSDQFIPDATLQTWRANYISRNGSGNTGGDRIPNPFQPNPNNLIPFAGNLGQSTIPLDQSLEPYPYFGSQSLILNKGYSTYHALQVAVKKDLNRGLILGANFTWSKSLSLDGGTTQNNFGGEGTGNTLPNLRDFRQDKRLSSNDTPIRFASYYVYTLPFGKGQAFSPNNGFVRALVSGYRISGTYIWQSGVPIQINCGSGSLNGLCDRNPSVPFILPKSFQHFYDGKTQVTLPGTGHIFTPNNNAFLKFNPDAFRGRLLTVPNGNQVQDIYWFGNSSTNYGDIRTNPVDNVTMSAERDVKIRERYTLNFQINATNLFNHTQFSAQTFSGSLGTIQTDPRFPTAIGYGNGGGYGHSLGTLDPRLVELQARFSF